MAEKLTTTPQQLHSQLQELEDDAEKMKVRLTEEVRQYISTNLKSVQQKLINNEPVYDEDMEFMNRVRMWVEMPEEWREKYPSVEDMKGAEEMKKLSLTDLQESQKEADARGINVKQWLNLLHVSKAAGEKREWIDETFDFSEEGKIVVQGDLNLYGCTSLTTLPEGLRVGTNLNLYGCIGLTELPEGLKVEYILNLSGCTSLTSLPNGLSLKSCLYLRGCTSLISLPEGLSVGGGLDMEGCTSLTSLPEGLWVWGNSKLKDCTSLTSLPKRLVLGGDLSLNGCTSLTSLSEELLFVRGNLLLGGCKSLTSFPDELFLWGDLYLNSCTSLTSLPEGLSVGGNLTLSGCKSLTSLPDGLSMGGDLYLSENLNEQVKKDAERLKTEGRIKGEVKYEN